MKIGYLRVSTEEQRPDRQVDGLTPICDEIHIERLSANSKHRPIFKGILSRLGQGDTLVVWALDRAFRSTVDAIQTAEALRADGIEFQIVNLGVDTSTADGKLVYTVIAAMAEHERNRLSERTKQGLAAAVKRGAILGRRPFLSERDVLAIRQKLELKEASHDELAAAYGVHRSTIFRALKRQTKIV